jgi:hypothetical protein
MLGVYLIFTMVIGVIIWNCTNNDPNVSSTMPSTIILPRTDISSIMPSTIRLPRTDNRSLPSIEPQPVENNNSNGRRARRISIKQHISSSPPKYDGVMRENSVPIAMQQQSLLPPSYGDFMRRNNRKVEITSL